MSASHTSLMSNYARQAVDFRRGHGCWLVDNEGREYFDALCGISVTNLGHAHPAITAAIEEQAGQLLHTSNLFHIEHQEQLAASLCELSGLDRAFFANSGAEANEAAVKLARLWAHEHGVTQPLVITFAGSFHGRTMGMIAATAGDKIKAGFEPILPGFLHLPFNDSAALEAAFAAHDNIAAVMLEPVQGEGGIHPVTPEFLALAAKLCANNQRGRRALLILDEVQSGNGRCGSYFAIEQYNQELLARGDNAIAPDIITTAKGLGNGLPIGACLASESVASVMVPGKHGSTFGGNPFCCRVALEVTRQISSQQLDQRATALGQRLAERFEQARAALPLISQIRQRGLMIGIELDRPCTELVAAGLAAGIVVNVTAGNVLRLLPPLIMSDADAELMADKVIALLEQFAATSH